MIGDSPLVDSYLQARYYGPYDNLPVNRVVIHYMGTSEKKDTAENVAQYFHTMSDGRVASATYCVDIDTIVQCVRENNIAYHAPPNTHSIGIEHAGTEQTKEQWDDGYSRTMLRLSARLCADICKRHNIPAVKLSVQDLLDGKRGICGHVDVSNAFHKTDHSDPGPNFPWDTYLRWVNEAIGTPTPTPVPEPTPEEADMYELVSIEESGVSYLFNGSTLLKAGTYKDVGKLFGLTEAEAREKFPIRYLAANHFAWKLPKVQ